MSLDWQEQEARSHWYEQNYDSLRDEYVRTRVDQFNLWLMEYCKDSIRFDAEFEGHIEDELMQEQFLSNNADEEMAFFHWCDNVWTERICR